MSAVESSGRYKVVKVVSSTTPWLYRVVNETAGGLDPYFIDTFRTPCAAEYAARLLNAGAARVDAHAVLGCKVVER